MKGKIRKITTLKGILRYIKGIVQVCTAVSIFMLLADVPASAATNLLTGGTYGCSGLVSGSIDSVFDSYIGSHASFSNSNSEASVWYHLTKPAIVTSYGACVGSLNPLCSYIWQ